MRAWGWVEGCGGCAFKWPPNGYRGRGVRKLNVHLNLNNEDEDASRCRSEVCRISRCGLVMAVDGVGLFDFDARINSKGVPERVNGMGCASAANISMNIC